MKSACMHFLPRFLFHISDLSSREPAKQLFEEIASMTPDVTP